MGTNCPECNEVIYDEYRYVWNSFILRCPHCGTIFNDCGEIYYSVGDEDDDWLKLYGQPSNNSPQYDSDEKLLKALEDINKDFLKECGWD